MNSDYKLIDGYVRAHCCNPAQSDRIVGYFSHDNFLKVHRFGCASLSGIEPDRIVRLEWTEILQEAEPPLPDDFNELSDKDFALLSHHLIMGIDYSLKVAGMIGVDKQTAFDMHKKMVALGLLRRVDATMVQYRKGVVSHKWIKHRNHTYYDLTPKGKKFIDYYLKRPK